MNRSVLIHNGILLVVIGSIMGWTQTVIYGFNIVPKSTPEAISELVYFLIVIVGFILVTVGRSLPGVPLNLHDTKWPRK